MIKFTYDLNAAAVEKALQAFPAALADATPALRRIADDFREMLTQQFASQGRAEGTPWAALAPSTARRRGPGATILYSTGALLRSLRDPGAPDHVEELAYQSLTLGSRLGYALYHQTGAGRGFGLTQLSAPAPSGTGRGRALPRRPIIVLSGARTERWVEMVRQQIEEKMLLLGGKELG